MLLYPYCCSHLYYFACKVSFIAIMIGFVMRVSAEDVELEEDDAEEEEISLARDFDNIMHIAWDTEIHCIVVAHHSIK